MFAGALVVLAVLAFPAADLIGSDWIDGFIGLLS